MLVATRYLCISITTIMILSGKRRSLLPATDLLQETVERGEVLPVHVGGVADQVVAVVAGFADLLPVAAGVARPRVLHATVATSAFDLWQKHVAHGL